MKGCKAMKKTKLLLFSLVIIGALCLTGCDMIFSILMGEHECQLVEYDRVESTCSEAGAIYYTCICGEEYEAALAEYKFDNTEDYSITYVLNMVGELVSVTETIISDSMTTEFTYTFHKGTPDISYPEGIEEYVDGNKGGGDSM